MSEDRKFRLVTTYRIGEDFSKEEYDKWLAQIALWLSETQKSVEDPKAKAKNILDSAIDGRKLNGEVWPGVEDFNLPNRIRQFCGWDIIKEVGRRRSPGRRGAKKRTAQAARNRRLNEVILTEESLTELILDREEYKAILFNEFPFLDNPVYEANVNALADASVKLQRTADRFLIADGSALKTLIDIRDSLKKDINDYMNLLKIHPSQLKDKVDEGDRGNVGTLVSKWEEYGEVSELYETVDAIQEAIQIISQLENTRVDGSPQLADWLLWHKTGCRGHNFVCPNCKESIHMHGGFTKEEMYAIAEQAYKTFGFGIKIAHETTAEDKKDTGETGKS